MARGGHSGQLVANALCVPAFAWARRPPSKARKDWPKFESNGVYAFGAWLGVCGGVARGEKEFGYQVEVARR